MKLAPHALTLALCAWATAANAQSTKLVDYVAEGKSAKAVMEELSTLLNLRLATNTSMGMEPLVIFVDKVDPEELLKRIAMAARGTWITESDGTRRLVEAKRQGDTEAQKIAKRIEAYKQSFAKTREELKATKPFDESSAKSLLSEIDAYLSNASSMDQNAYYRDGEKIGAKGPVAVLAKRVSVDLEPKILATVTRNRKAVWSTHPTRMQYKLPESVMPAIRQFVKDYDVWRNAVGGRTFRYPEDRGLATPMYYLLQKNFDWDDGDLGDQKPLMKVLVFATTWNDAGANSIEVKLVDKDGRYAATSSFSIDVSGMRSEADGGDPAKLFAKGVDPNEPDIEFSDVSKEFTTRLQSIFGGSEDGPQLDNKPLSKELEERLVSPEKFDPASFVAPDVLRSLAKVKKLDVVACPPDIAALMIAFLSSQNLNKPSHALNMMKSNMVGMEIVSEGEWITMTSQLTGGDMPFDSSKRLDRNVLGIMMREVKKQGYLSLESQATFAYKYGGGGMSAAQYVAGLWTGMLAGNQANQTFMDMENAWLRFYGSLDVNQAQTLRSRGKLKFGGLRPDQKEIVETFAFGARNYELQYEPVKPRENQDSWRAFHEGILGEGTERWPNGLDPNTEITMNEENEPIVFARGMQDKYQTNQEMTAQQLGQHLFMLETPGYYGGDYQPPQYTSFQFMQQRKLNFTAQFDPEVSSQGSISEKRGSLKAVNSIDQLPAEFLAKVMAAKKKAAEDYQKYRQNDPPPPARWR